MRHWIALVLLVGIGLAVTWSTSSYTEAGSGVLGDANCDGTVNPIDAALILQFSAGLLSVLPCAENADVNGDGNINALDAALVLQLSAGLIQSIGPESTPTRPPTNPPTPTNTPLATSTPTRSPTATDTPTPTDTPTSSPTNTQIATPTSTATSIPAPTAPQSPTQTGPVIVQNSTWYVDSWTGSIWVVGEVVNGLDHEVAFVDVTAYLYSASNTLLDTTLPWSACVGTIPAGGDSPYKILMFDPPVGVDHVEVAVTGYDEPPFYFDPPVVGLDLTITNVYTDYIDWRHVEGTVMNNSSFTYESVKVCAAFYDSSGNVVRTDLDLVSPSTMRPYRVRTFDAMTDTEGASIVSERVWASAYYEEESGGCDPSYPTVCIPPPPPNLNCSDIAYTDFTVVGDDPHGFDGDNDGIGCES